jgi:hypothetical protein
MTYRRKKRLNWTLTEKPVPQWSALTELGHSLLALAEAATAVGTSLSTLEQLFRSGKFSLTNSSSEVTPTGKPATSADSSKVTRPTSYSKGKSNEKAVARGKSKRLQTTGRRMQPRLLRRLFHYFDILGW